MGWSPFGLTVRVDLLPPPLDLRFIEEKHAYRIWSRRQSRWLRIFSVSSVKRAGSQIPGFDRSNWRRSLQRAGLTAEEAEQQMDRHTEHRANVGTDLHNLIRAYISGGHLGMPCPWILPDTEPAAIFRVWLQEFAPRIRRVLLLEQPLAHRQLFFAGTPDLVAELDDGRVWLVDWKTKASAEKASPSGDWVHQAEAYRGLVWHQYGLMPDRAANVIAWHDGLKLCPWSTPELDLAGEQFRLAIREHHQKRALGGCPIHQRALELMP